MPAATLPPPKRALADSTKANQNIKATIPSPNSAKRRKLETINSSPSKRLKSSQNVIKTGSSQPGKSQFEGDLEKLTQDITGLKQQNSEKDQQWDRPSLDDFSPDRDNLCFQQIEAEEGTLHGGRTTIKLFGVTEVGAHALDTPGHANTVCLDWPLRSSPCYRLPPLPLCRRSGPLCSQPTVAASRPTSRHN